jgi:RimJ/RimL family protein N-acetyltransferase
VDGIKRPLHAFVVMLDEISVGYIQYYNAYDFSRDTVLENLPQSLAALDLYIGDPAYIGKGLAAPILRAFLEDHVWRTFQHCLVDPDVKNIAAIKAYQKAGFVMVKHVDDMVWLVATRSATIV